MGTPEFAVPSLDILYKNGYEIVGVITAPDKPAGRGKKLSESAVKKFALQNGLPLLQPEKLKSPDFIQQLKNLKADLQVVVAFRMLPEIVWKMPRLGTFNLHASLLPKYRGAAPMNWAIINGETETGLTTFFLDQLIDTGEIIFNEKILINPDETLGKLHDEMMIKGADLVLKTTRAIQEGNVKLTKQDLILSGEVEIKPAPKIHKTDCKINWNNKCSEIYNLVRGLSPYPAAFSEFISPDNKKILFKIFKATIEKDNHDHIPGTILTDKKSFLIIAANGGFINIIELQLAGKKKMYVSDFLRGFKISENWRVE
jgi:methionyl-tRNA formyltransferase